MLVIQMIRKLTPGRIIILGFILSLIGLVLPFLMVLRVIDSTLFLNFAAYLTSVAGLIIGFVGMAIMVKVHRRDKD